MQWGVEEENKLLMAKDEDEFRRRLKKSFSGAEALEPRPAQASACLVCCEPLAAGYASITRKCLRTAHPCSGATCKCLSAQACPDCLMQLLWKSPRSQKQLGRFRATCPFCKAEFCHWDVGFVVYEGGKGEEAGPRRVALERVCGAAERKAIIEFAQSQLETASTPLERLVRSFVLSDETSRELSLNGEERKEVHRLAEAQGLGHESRGEGEQRALVLSKGPGWRRCDAVVFVGYLQLVGDSVDWAASQFLGKVPPAARAKREERDGTAAHHVTLVSRKEMAGLAKRAGEKAFARKVTVGLLRGLMEAGVANDWTVEGLGSVAAGDNRCWYVVLTWPAANAWRVQNGLPPATFHITLGFLTADIHDVPKDIATLIERGSGK